MGDPYYAESLDYGIITDRYDAVTKSISMMNTGAEPVLLLVHFCRLHIIVETAGVGGQARRDNLEDGKSQILD